MYENRKMYSDATAQRTTAKQTHLLRALAARIEKREHGGLPPHLLRRVAAVVNFTSVPVDGAATKLDANVMVGKQKVVLARGPAIGAHKPNTS